MKLEPRWLHHLFGSFAGTVPLPAIHKSLMVSHLRFSVSVSSGQYYRFQPLISNYKKGYVPPRTGLSNTYVNRDLRSLSAFNQLVIFRRLCMTILGNHSFTSFTSRSGLDPPPRSRPSPDLVTLGPRHSQYRKLAFDQRPGVRPTSHSTTTIYGISLICGVIFT